MCPKMGTSIMVKLFSVALNFTAILMCISLMLGPIYLFLSLLGGPLAIAISFVMGSDFLIKWFMMVIASIFIQLSVGIAYAVISDTNGFAAVSVFAGEGGSLELALNMIILCVVMVLAVPMIHGYIYSTAFFYVFPAIVGGAVVVFEAGMSLYNICTFALISSKQKKTGA